MNLHPERVSVTEPVGLAIERVKEVLFRPFNFGKWITIGFCAWLASLGGGGGGGGGFNYSNGYSNPRTFPTPTPAPFPPGGPVPRGAPSAPSQQSSDMHAVGDFLSAHMGVIILGVVVFVVFVLAVLTVFLWLGSRGSFMLLDCVAKNRGEIGEPWKRYRNEANSLWRFRLVLMGIGLVILLPVMGAGGWMVFKMIQAHGVDEGNMLGVLGLGLVMFATTLALGVVTSFTQNFVTIIMYSRGGTCREAWGVLWQLVSANLGRFVLYLLFQIVLAMATGLLVVAFIVCTLLIGLILLVIPFVGTVVLLPVIVFYRSYSIYFLAQFGDEFLVFAQADPPPLPQAPTNMWGEPPLPPPIR